MKTKLLRAALIGRDVSGSPSPQLHTLLFPYIATSGMHAFEGIDYEAVNCSTPETARLGVERLWKDGYAGVNITAPYKGIAAEVSAHKSEEVTETHSGNCLRFGDPSFAYATDGIGFLTALQRQVQFDPANYSLAILGSGGAAKSIAFALKDLPWKNVEMFRRSSNNDALFQRFFPKVRFKDFDEGLQRGSHSLIAIQATSIAPPSENWSATWREGDIACDVVYRPLRTAFLQRASENGAVAVDGLGMLIEQAAYSQSIWLNGSMPVTSPLSDESHFAIREQMQSLLIR